LIRKLTSGAAGVRGDRYARCGRRSDRHAGALTVAAEGGKSAKAKPFKGVDGGVFEIARPYRGDAYRTLYAVQIGADIWVIHAFQKKSKSGIETPKMEVDLIRDRLKRLKEALK